MISRSLEAELQHFIVERDWEQFHTPENLAKSISIEAAELLECFQWSDEVRHERVASELADVLTYCLLLASRLGLNAEQIILAKLELTRQKYPIEKSISRSTKYDQL